MLKDLRMDQALFIARRCRLLKARTGAALAVYYGLAVLNAAIDGVSLVLLIDLVTGKTPLESGAPVMDLVTGVLAGLGIAPDYAALYMALMALFLLRVALMFAYTAMDGFFEASARRIIQEQGFSSVMAGDWEELRSIRVGERVGAVTEEASNAAKYFMSGARALYSGLTVLVLSIIALTVSLDVSILFLIIGAPVLIVLRRLFSLQAKAAEKLVDERQGFYANVTERLHGLFQIKVEGNAAHHVEQGLRNQKRLTQLEVRWWNLRAVIYAFNVLLPVAVLAAGYGWAAHKGIRLQELMTVMAGVGVIGARALAQLNQLTSNVGNLTGYAGSITPVHALFSIRQEPVKKAVPEKIRGVEVKDASYMYNEKAGVKRMSLSAFVGSPLIMMGPSGSGKTTLANLIAGLYRPAEGAVSYVGESGNAYNSLEYRPKVGYVTQDIHLFHGTVRENLAASLGSHVDDAWLAERLRQAGAEEFVEEMGGLGAVIAEGGRSLSGGQRRRLGIARVLTAAPDILILDEVTAGLDEGRKAELLSTIKRLSESLVVVMITHDALQAGFGTVYAFKHER
ncbi:MAG: ABC transporter ATP-binding protein [Deltaproteobacteria bacterium]|nr:ABC transporter ATP-binding protein [Deltaproteobacteria bacterium]